MGQIQSVGFIIIKLYVHVNQIILDGRQTVDPNVLWIPIVQQRWLVFAINARVLAMEHVVQMPTAPFSIIRHIVFAMMNSSAIHTVDAVKLLSVSKLVEFR